MRLFFCGLLLCLLGSSVALSQSKPVLESKGELEFGDAKERILAHKFLDDENSLLLVGRKSVRRLEMGSAKFVESHSIEIPDFSEDEPRVVSPDGRRMLVFGNYSFKDKVKRPASIWDLQTGKQIAVLDKTARPVRAGAWSKNGKTLVTSSNKYVPFVFGSTSVEVAFWDGETFKLQNSLPSDKVSWWYLTGDGDKCFYSVGAGRNLIIAKYINVTGGPVSVWDIGGGKIEQTILAGEGSVERKIRAITLSPDEKFLALVAQPPKANNTERRLLVYEIDKSRAAYEIKAKYEIKPEPHINEYGVNFSPDGKYFALDSGQNIQIYETQTGHKKSELTKLDNPNHWVNDNKILLYNYGPEMKAFEVATGRQLYQQKLIYVTYQSTETDDTPTTTQVLDSTTIVLHPNRQMFLTYSKQYVKVFDSNTGQLLQTLVSPPMDYIWSKKKPELSDKPLVKKADWSQDGRTLYVISADERSVSLWGLL